MTFLSRLSWFVAILMLYGVAKLLFDNILYAAIMRWLSAHGIEESDMVAVVTANLIPIAGAIALPAAIYWLSMQHHATKAKPVPAAEPPKAEIRPSFFRRLVARLITWDDPLPIIASSLVVAFVVGIVWQVNFGPLTHLRKPVPSTPTEIVLSPAEMLAARTAVKQISVSFLFVRQGLDKWRDLLENWQYQIQTNGPDEFLKSAGEIYSGVALAGFLGMSNAMSGMDMKRYPDIAEIAKNDSPDCLGKPMAFYNEVKRIRDHKGADMTFTLINNTKMSDMRAALPGCMSWMAARAAAIAKVETKYKVAL